MEDLYSMSAWRDSKRIRLLSCWEPVSVRDRALKAQLPSPVVTIGLKVCRSSGWHCCDACVSCDKCGCDSTNGVGSALRMVTRVSSVEPCSVMVWLTSFMVLSLRLCSIDSGVTPPKAVLAACWSCLMPGGEGRVASACKGSALLAPRAFLVGCSSTDLATSVLFLFVGVFLGAVVLYCSDL